MLPHLYPFRLVDRRPDGEILVQLASSAYWGRRAPDPLPLTLAIEILAQAAALVSDSDEGERGAPSSEVALAGIDRAELHRPLVVGMRCRVEAEIVGRLGRLSKVEGRLLDEAGDCVAEAALLLAG